MASSFCSLNAMQYLKTPEAFLRIMDLIRNDLDERDRRILAIHLYRGDHIGEIIEVYRNADAAEAEAKNQKPKKRKRISVAHRARLQREYQRKWRAEHPGYHKWYREMVVCRKAYWAAQQEKAKVPCPIMAEVNKEYDECLVVASDLCASIRTSIKAMYAMTDSMQRLTQEPKLRSLRRMVDNLRSLGEPIERRVPEELVAELESFEAAFAYISLQQQCGIP